MTYFIRLIGGNFAWDSLKNIFIIQKITDAITTQYLICCLIQYIISCKTQTHLKK